MNSFRKTIIVILVCVICGHLDAQTKVALIPTAPDLAPVADQVLAAMSNEPGVEFLERSSIEAVFSERKLTASGLTGSNLAELGKLIHAELFAIITAKPGEKGAMVSGLIVYDARNGFRLVNVMLPEQDAVKEIAKRLRQAQEVIQHPEKQILLSVATVRNAGIPERFKYQEAFIAADLERRLGGIPNVTVLERDYLDSVNQECKTTEQMFELAPSSRLLRLEFAPGSSPEIVNLLLRVTDAANKELFRFNLDNCLADTEATEMKTIVAVAEYLKVSPPNITASASEEAARFFAEYQFFSRLGDYAAARHKLDAAIALEPMKLEYRMAVLSLNKETPANSCREMVLRQQRAFDLSLEIERDFPLLREPLYSNGSYYDWNLMNSIGQATPQDLAEMKSFAAVFRPKYDAEIRRIYYKFDISDGVKTYEDLEMHDRYCSYMSRFHLYFDADLWVENIYRGALQRLELSKAFFLAHPELCKKPDISDGVSDWFFNLGSEYRELRHKTNIDSKSAVEKVLRNSKEYIELAMLHPLSQTSIMSLRIDLLRKTVKSNYDPETFKDNMLEYCRQLSAINPEECKKIDDHEINFFWDDNNPLRRISYEVHRDFVASQRSQVPASDTATTLRPMTELFDDVRLLKISEAKSRTPQEQAKMQVKLAEAKAKKLLELAPQLRQYVKLSFTDPEVRDFFLESDSLLNQYVWREKNPVFRQAIEALNCDVTIKKIATVDDQNKFDYGDVRISNAVWHDGEIYMLLYRHLKDPERDLRGWNYQDTWNIAQLDMAAGKINALSLWFQPAEQSQDWDTSRMTPLAVAGKMAAVGGNNAIHLFPFDGIPQVIKDLPDGIVKAVAIMNDRIYAFIGKENTNGLDYAKEITLFSCKFDGSDRQIHISSSRDNKQNNMDREKPFSVYSMIADKNKNRLVFNCASLNGSGNVNGLWEFNLSTNTGKCLFDIQYKWIDKIMTAVDDHIFFSFFLWDSCIYDLAADKGEVFFSIANETAKNYLKVKVRPAQGIFYHGPFFARPNQIWFGGDGGVKLLTLPGISHSPMIILPFGRFSPGWNRLLFPHPDGKSAIAIDERNIYKITPKERGVETQ